jgi:hypothetical protein
MLFSSFIVHRSSFIVSFYDYFIYHRSPQLHVGVLRERLFFNPTVSKDSLRGGRGGDVGFYRLGDVPDLPAEPAEETVAGMMGWVGHGKKH